MALKRMLLEIGMGNVLHGGDYTKAAVRAVQDAVHHSSMTMVRALGIEYKDVVVEVTVGVQQPDKVDAKAVADSLPGGKVTVKAVPGGLDIHDDDRDDLAVIASAAIVVRMDIP